MDDHVDDQEPTRPSAATREEEAREAKASPQAGRPATDAEERAADANPPVSPDVAERYEEMTERGAQQTGEGRIP